MVQETMNGCWGMGLDEQLGKKRSGRRGVQSWGYASTRFRLTLGAWVPTPRSTTSNSKHYIRHTMMLGSCTPTFPNLTTLFYPAPSVGYDSTYSSNSAAPRHQLRHVPRRPHHPPRSLQGTSVVAGRQTGSVAGPSPYYSRTLREYSVGCQVESLPDIDRSRRAL